MEEAVAAARATRVLLQGGGRPTLLSWSRVGTPGGVGWGGGNGAEPPECIFRKNISPNFSLCRVLKDSGERCWRKASEGAGEAAGGPPQGSPHPQRSRPAPATLSPGSCCPLSETWPPLCPELHGPCHRPVPGGPGSLSFAKCRRADLSTEGDGRAGSWDARHLVGLFVWPSGKLSTRVRSNSAREAPPPPTTVRLDQPKAPWRRPGRASPPMDESLQVPGGSGAQQTHLCCWLPS